jgi:hypothetical protein
MNVSGKFTFDAVTHGSTRLLWTKCDHRQLQEQWQNSEIDVAYIIYPLH